MSNTSTTFTDLRTPINPDREDWWAEHAAELSYGDPLDNPGRRLAFDEVEDLHLAIGAAFEVLRIGAPADEFTTTAHEDSDLEVIVTRHSDATPGDAPVTFSLNGGDTVEVAGEVSVTIRFPDCEFVVTDFRNAIKLFIESGALLKSTGVQARDLGLIPA